ncbi:RING finger domain protein [Aspergillus alliaceus]|uniref:RING finger domain protein n=1 Tax=Petromyces alliaceus TaxID=209559 RepID=UPI0012A62963|nr:uncharacterized protein BDW43DRAFT_173549 [Aspergillus alliaceus]KAB8229959.1 hypothetical protein BDW43DRAFT_173549 [Aspergillus alliaceus]
MASMPGYSTSTSRPRSSDNASTTTSIPGTTTSPTAESMEDNETVLLNRPSLGEGNAASASPIERVTPVDTAKKEPRQCWICYTDETEESPLNTEWRSPCPCAITAHEACLLDWLADLEKPRSRKRSGRTAKMVCPQCKSEIVVSRPRSYIVDMVRALERFAGRLVLPGVVFTIAGTVWAACCAHGVSSMYFVFGPEDARLILEESADGAWNSGLNLGLPLIPLALIFSRTRYAEGLLPAIPVLFFATHNPGRETDFELWPPSAAMTFAALPYVKSFYSTVYRRMFGKMEKRWIAEVQPRQSDVNEFDDNAPPEHPEPDPVQNAGNPHVLMEFDLQLGNNGEAAGGGQIEGLGIGRHAELISETSNLADIVLGALAFPAISAAMGGLLKYVLPKSWTAAPSVLERTKPGLLQTRWGRSVVGGCVFVFLKDALILYCRWKLAHTHRRRKVLNYDQAKKQVK